MKAPPTNIAASVTARLQEFSRAHAQDHNLTLMRYATERFLYRLSQSRHADRFVLKGAMLYATWGTGYANALYRPTRDVDFLGLGDSSAHELRQVITDICQTPVSDDGLVFDVGSISIEDIRGDQEYPGLRIRLTSFLGRSRIPLQLDIGFGDVVTPQAVQIDYPTILDMPAPRLPAYTPESVVAEKVEAIVRFGIGNSRMKDYYDIWNMARSLTFDGRIVAAAIRNTFDRRRTEPPGTVPVGLTDRFGSDPDKNTQWRAFLNRTGLGDQKATLREVVAALREFLSEPLSAAATGATFSKSWESGGPWV